MQTSDAVMLFYCCHMAKINAFQCCQYHFYCNASGWCCSRCDM